MELTRRRFVIGTAIGGALLVGWAARPGQYPDPLPGAPGDLALGGWLRLGTGGVLTVAVPQLEMGQGVGTLLAQVAAVELGADWRRVALQPVPPSELYPNAVLAARWAMLWMPAFAGLADDPAGMVARRWATAARFDATAEGTALAAYEAPLRLAAAALRELLAQAAAARWGVDPAACTVAAGMVHHGAQALAIGKLVAEAARLTPPDAPPLRARAAFEVAGTGGAFPRLDSPAMVDGGTQFAGDIRLPGMAFAAIRQAPLGAGPGTLGHYDAARAHGQAGFIRLVENPRWLAAVGDSWWAAERALARIGPRFHVHAPLESTAIEAALDKALHSGTATTVASLGDPAQWLAGPALITRRYDVAPAQHATLECASATARLRDGRVELWLASQAPEAAREAVARALDVPVRNVILYPVPAGGSFDRRLEHEHAVQAALIARAAGRPVQLMWSRWQEALAGLPRAPMAAQVSARLAPSGALFAWKARIATPPALRELGARLFGGHDPAAARAAMAGQADAMALAGAMPPYALPHVSIEHVPVELPLAAGKMRGGGHGLTAFLTESFIDELAVAGRHEPLSFRMGLLGDDPRLAQCLQRVSTLGGWNGGNDGSGQGIACHRIGPVASGGCIAAVATARRDAAGVRVDRISVVADIGRVVNLDLARQQLEGGLIYGIGLALGGAATYAAGLPTTARLAAQALPLLADCPEIVVECIDSVAPAFDPGELGLAVAAPVIANALFSATGLRFRRLPLTSEE